MNIALMAHTNRRELLVQFCIAYRGILSQHQLCATALTGRAISEETGLDIYSFISSEQGGYEQIGARIAYNEIDLVIFFRAPSELESDGNVDKIGRLCDANSIPMATNLATAEVLIQGLQRGDFAWRDIVNPKRNGTTQL